MSRPARGKLLLVMAFVLTLCAGIVVGVGLSKQAGAGNPPVLSGTAPPLPVPAGPGSWFADKLKLSPTQTEQMKAIWSEAMQGAGEELFDRRRSLYRERDRAIEALYTDEQKAERERLKKEFDVKLAENSKEREKLVQAAVEKTKAMLNPEQRDVYEKMLRERADRDRHRGPSSRSSTQPSDRPGPSFGPGPRDSFDRRRGGDDRGGPDRSGPDRGGSERGGPERGGPDRGPRGSGGEPAGEPRTPDNK